MVIRRYKEKGVSDTGHEAGFGKPHADRPLQEGRVVGQPARDERLRNQILTRRGAEAGVTSCTTETQRHREETGIPSLLRAFTETILQIIFTRTSMISVSLW